MAKQKEEPKEKNFIENILGFAGDAARGVFELPGNIAEAAGDLSARAKFGGREFSPSRQRATKNELDALISTYRSIDPKDKPKREEALRLIQQTPTFQKFNAQFTGLATAAVDKSEATAAAHGQIQQLGKTMQSLQDAGFVVEGDDVTKGLQGKALRLASLLIPDGEDPDNPRTGAEALSGIINKKRTGTSKEKRAAMVAEFRSKKGTGAFKRELGDNFGFSGDEISKLSRFTEQATTPEGVTAASALGGDATGTKKKGSSSRALTDENFTAFEDFVQVGTEQFPEDNTRKSRASFGIVDAADQQSMQEIEQAAPPEMDIQAIAQQDPAAFRQMMASLRKGKTPSGKKFTMKDAIEMMGKL